VRQIIHILTIVALGVTALLFAQSQTPRTTTRVPQVTSRMTDEQRLQRTVMTQQRLNRYFHSAVIPKLGNCWSHIQGTGTIQINHNYARDVDGKWVTKDLTIGNSTLTRGQEVVALRCMQDAVRGSSFPSTNDDGNSKEYVVRWSWPVPFPTNMEEQTRAMFAAQGGVSGTGCDGKGAPATCWDCIQIKGGTDTKCERRCSGYKECAYGPSNSCQAVSICVSGSPFSVAGRAVMY